MTLKRIDVFTNEYNIVNILLKDFTINKIFTQNKSLYKIIKRFKIDISLVDNCVDILKIHTVSCDLGISYGFGIIFKKKIIKKYKEGIWNIHSGDLPKYRGRHPITAAFLNNEKKIGLSMHSINHEIDRGYLLSKIFVNRNYQDDELSIKKKHMRNVRKLIRLGRKNFQNKNILKISKGKYFKPFFDGITIDDSKNFEHLYIYNAAKAQKCFGGIKVNDKRYYDAMFFSQKKINSTNKVIFCKDNKKLILLKKK